MGWEGSVFGVMEAQLWNTQLFYVLHGCSIATHMYGVLLSTKSFTDQISILGP
jgi:hypothetical protein